MESTCEEINQLSNNIETVESVVDKMDYTEGDSDNEIENIEIKENSREEELNSERENDGYQDDDLNESGEMSDTCSEDEFWECNEAGHEKGKIGNCCQKKKVAALKMRLLKLVKECERVKKLMLEKLLELSKILVDYEYSKSTRYLYIGDNKPDLKTIERVAGNVFPEFRRLETNLQSASKLISDCNTFVNLGN